MASNSDCNVGSNRASSSRMFSNNVVDDEHHTPVKQKGRKRKTNDEVFSPERDMNFSTNAKRQHVSKFKMAANWHFSIAIYVMLHALYSINFCIVNMLTYSKS